MEEVCLTLFQWGLFWNNQVLPSLVGTDGMVLNPNNHYNYKQLAFNLISVHQILECDQTKLTTVLLPGVKSSC